MKYVIQAGQNKSLPLTPVLGFGSPLIHKWTLSFDENCLYPQQYLGSDKYDGYNKVCGVAFDLARPDYNTAMCGWRSKDGILRITPYFNVNGAKIKDETNELTVNPKDIIEVSLTVINKVCILSITSNGKTVKATQSFTKTYGLFGIYHPINFWFGGQLPTKDLVSVDIIKF